MVRLPASFRLEHTKLTSSRRVLLFFIKAHDVLHRLPPAIFLGRFSSFIKAHDVFHRLLPLSFLGGYSSRSLHLSLRLTTFSISFLLLSFVSQVGYYGKYTPT